ncbi:MAG: Blue-light-activated protein [Deltaproteobacteria bacterium ADurb.Bin151]|jgi:PAS domain S-box-containing protein|nr:response regulator [Smithella sp.]OQB55332.1 MAG: Blue-light-activated protein [Deltaproteobacteria bacterium ADurb.Bin151]HNZ10490.1 response regulator [Smithellaceae bacterium]HOG81373.1 response regulator [Smithellaceae bacterium]HQP24632.1 response regulator [Smithellaceae bacterium]
MKKVLIVDDVAENRYILEKVLGGHQMEVMSAQNGQAALDKAYANPPDLIISDILMPVMDGYTLCKIWKSDDHLKNIPFIFYTATYTDPKDETFAKNLGADLFIIKPQEPNVIIETIKEIIEKDHVVQSAQYQPLGSEMEFFRQYNEILFRKLEKKVLDLELLNRRLNQEIEKHKQTEEKLFKLSQSIEESPVAFVLMDVNGNLEYVNPQFFRISGYAPRNMIGLNVKSLQPTGSQTDDFQEAWESVGADNIWRGEMQIKKQDGECFWAYLTLLPLKNPEGRVNSMMMIMEDTSEKRQLEAQLIQSQKLEGIGQLAGGVAHDFNNILTAIIGYAQLVYLNMQNDDTNRGHIKHILDYSEKAATITKSLLAFSRKQTTNLSCFNVNDLISDFQKLLLRLMPENIEIQTQFTSQKLSVLVDQVQLEQVIMNLATNARDAMPDGGLIIIATNMTEIDQEFIKSNGYGRTGSYAQITMADMGRGMNRQTLDKIFEPFFTTKEPGKGTGLGMTIVYNIVSRHNGFITVESEPGKGTRVRILLPIVQAAEDVNGSKTEEYIEQGGARTILVAEDDSGIRDLITTILTERGYEVIGVADGVEAVKQFSENREKVSLVMLDGIMPKKNGREAYREIRAMKPDVKVIFMSGYLENMLDFDHLMEREIHFLQKPVLPLDILKKIQELLGPGKN